MKYGGKEVPKYKYALGARVYVTKLPGSPMGRVTRQVYEGKGYGWHYRVELYKGQKYYGTAKFWGEKSLRKVRSDCKTRGKK